MNAQAAAAAAGGGGRAPGVQCGFVLVNGPDIVDKFIGGSGEKIRGVFKKASVIAQVKPEEYRNFSFLIFNACKAVLEGLTIKFLSLTYRPNEVH